MLRVADHAARTDTGRQRPANEDSYFASLPLFVVADGMGGAQAGEVASRTAVEFFTDGLPDGPGTPEERLAALVARANARIHELASSDDAFAGMGTTLTAAYVGEHDLAIAHVGDSRLYVLRDGALTQLTDDHSLVGELIRRGQIRAEEAEEHPQRSIITRALGIEQDVVVDHHTWPVRDGDVVLICSDGLTGMVSDARVAEIVSEAPSLSVAAQRLIAAANEAGGRDNITVILFRLEDVGSIGGGGGSSQDTTEHDAVTAPGTTEVGGAAATEPATAAGAAAAGPATAVAAPPAQPSGRRREPRAPRPPREDGRRRRRVPVGLLLGFFLVVAILLSAYYASQTVYFVGTSNDGFVTVYRGLPYDGPAGVDLYSVNYLSGVPVSELPAGQRRLVTEHKLRSRDDAQDLVRQMETGALRSS